MSDDAKNTYDWCRGQFARIPVEVMLTSGFRALSASAIRVYLAIVSQAGKDGTPWLAYSMIAELSGVPRQNVYSRGIEPLVEARLIDVAGKQNGTQRYRLITPGAVNQTVDNQSVDNQIVDNETVGSAVNQTVDALSTKRLKTVNQTVDLSDIQRKQIRTEKSAALGGPAAPSSIPYAFHVVSKAEEDPTESQPSNRNLAKADGVHGGSEGYDSNPLQKGTSKIPAASKAAKPVGIQSAFEKLTDDHKRAIQADKSLTALGAYLLFGPGAIGLPQDQWSSLKPSPSHWAPGEATYVRPVVNANTKQLSSYAIYRINQARVTVGHDEPAILNWGRVGGSIKRLRERHTQDELVAILDTIATKWPAVQAALPHWMKSPPLFDASILANEHILDAARRVASGVPIVQPPQHTNQSSFQDRQSTPSDDWIAGVVSRKSIVF